MQCHVAAQGLLLVGDAPRPKTTGYLPYETGHRARILVREFLNLLDAAATLAGVLWPDIR